MYRITDVLFASRQTGVAKTCNVSYSGRHVSNRPHERFNGDDWGTSIEIESIRFFEPSDLFISKRHETHKTLHSVANF